MININLGGKKRPFKFGTAATLFYEEATGRNAFEDFQSISEKPSLGIMVDLVTSGMKAGASLEKQEFDHDKFEVAEWLDEEGAWDEVVKALQSVQFGGLSAKKKGSQKAVKGKRKSS